MLRPASLLLSLAIGVAAHAESFTFRFAPPVDKPVVQTVTSTVTTNAGGKTTTRVTRERTVLRYRKTGDGYVLSGTVTESKVTVDGDDAGEDFAKLLEGVDVSYEIAGDGELKAVRGYDAVARKLHDALPKDAPADAKAALANLFSEEMLVTRARAEWDGRISGFTGMTVEVGDEYESESEVSLPGGGGVKYYTTTTIESVETCGDTRCLRIVFDVDTDAGAMKETLDSAMKAVPDTTLKTDGLTITGSGERLIDPATMNIYREVNERTMRVTMNTPEGKQLVTRTEKKEYAFEYSPGPRSSSAR